MTAATASIQEKKGALRGDALPLLAIAGAVLFTYRALIGFEPYAPVPTDVRGLEGALFDPVPSAPGFVFIVFLWKLAEHHHPIRVALRGPGALGWAGLPLGLSLGVLGWATYTGADELLLPSLSLLLIAGGLALGGRRGADELAVPALILLFAWPIPADLLNLVMFDLQLATAAISSTIASTWSDAIRSGDLIYHDKQIFQVIESCAGLATISTLTLTSFIIPTRTPRKRAHAALLVLSAPLLAFAFNSARVLTIMENPLSHIGTVHTTQGIVMLVVGILSLVAIDRGLGRLFGPAPRPPRAPQQPVSFQRLYVAAATVVAFGAIGLAVPHWEGEKLPHQTFRKLRVLEGLPGRSHGVDKDFLGTVAFTQSTHTRYEEGDTWVDLFVGVNNRRIRHNSAVSPKTALPGAGWVLVGSGPSRHPASNRPVTELFVDPPPHLPPEERQRVLVHHFTIGTDTLLAAAGRALLALDTSPFRRLDRQIVVRLATPVGDTEVSRTAAAERLRDFAALLEVNLAREHSGPESS